MSKWFAFPAGPAYVFRGPKCRPRRTYLRMNPQKNRISIKQLIESFLALMPRRVESDPYSKMLPNFIANVKANPSARILEVGARNVTGNPVRQNFAGFDYVGMDIHPGENVDIVGDAHRLSETFPENSFDAIISIAVFEHLFFPWKVAMEMNKVLRPNGRVIVVTHPTWPSHELPWDFWRFQENGMHALFNKATGFKVVDVKEGLPARLLPLVLDRAFANVGLFNVNMAIAVEAVKIGPVDPRLRWDVPYNEITDTMYPLPSK